MYGMGSLYTSVCPILCLDGMGEMIATREVPKVSVEEEDVWGRMKCVGGVGSDHNVGWWPRGL